MTSLQCHSQQNSNCQRAPLVGRSGAGLEAQNRTSAGLGAAPLFVALPILYALAKRDCMSPIARLSTPISPSHGFARPLVLPVSARPRLRNRHSSERAGFKSEPRRQSRTILPSFLRPIGNPAFWLRSIISNLCEVFALFRQRRGGVSRPPFFNCGQALFLPGFLEPRPILEAVLTPSHIRGGFSLPLAQLHSHFRF